MYSNRILRSNNCFIMEGRFNSGMSSINPVPPLKIRLMPFSTKFPSNSKAYIAFSISIGSAFVLLCVFVIHFRSKHVLLIIFRPVIEHLSHIYAVITDYIGKNLLVFANIHEIDLFRPHKQIHKYLLYFYKTLVILLTKNTEIKSFDPLVYFSRFTTPIASFG